MLPTRLDRVNIKTVFVGIGIPMLKIRWSYLTWDPYTDKTTFLYWDGPQGASPRSYIDIEAY